MATASEGDPGKKAVSTILLTETRKATEVLSGIVHATVVHTNEGDDFSKEASTLKGVIENLDLSVSDKMFCSYCNTTFSDREEQTSHYKTDWHRFNLKQKLRNARQVSVEEFEEMTGDISSISGSDSESSDSEELLTRKVDNDIEDESSGHIEGIGRRHPRVFFRNKNDQLLSIYRCVIHGRRNQPTTLDDLVSLSTQLPSQMTWTVLLTAGGHFAGAVFEGGEMIAHKTFHRYVVRAKRGTVQSARDAQGNAPKSAGANLRRYNEAALTQEVQDLLVTWTDNLKASDRIFIRVPSYNKTIYYSSKNSPLQKDDARIRMIPFSTRRPTMKEAKRVHDILATIECYGSDTDLSDHIKKSPVKQFQKPIAKPAPKQPLSKKKKSVRQTDFSDESSSDTDLGEEGLVLSFQQEVIDTVDLLKPFDATKKPRRRKGKDKTSSNKQYGENVSKEDVNFRRVRNALYTACKVGDLNSLNRILKNLEEPEKLKRDLVQTAEKDQKDFQKDGADITVCDSIQTGDANHQGDGVCDCKTKTTEILNKPFGHQERTLLHIAATESHKPIIYRLLEAGADPAIKDMCGQVPYNCAKTKDVRGEFRTFMRSYPDKYDYELAQVPAPLSVEKEAEKKAKEAEKKKAQRKVKREKQKVQREEEDKKRAEEKERERYLALSDREKRALAAEKRLASQITSSGGAAPVLSAGNSKTKVSKSRCPLRFQYLKDLYVSIVQKHCECLTVKNMMKGKTYTIYGNSKEMQKESENGKVHHTPPDVSPYVWPSPDGLLEDVRVVPQQTQQSSAESLHSPPSHELQYRIEDNPPWHLCIILGFQHYLTMFGATIAIPLIVAPALCIGDDSVAKSEILGTLLFVSGLVTIIQTTVGIRLPIIQGGTFSFLVPTFAILSLPQWKCPDPPEGHNETINGSIVYVEGGFTEDEHKEIWQSRMREIQGAIIVSALFQVVIGFSGIIGIILRFIGPLTIAPTIALIGLSLFGAASDFSSKQWGIAFLTMFLITLFSQYLRNIEIPCLGYNKRKLGVIKYPLFKSFPVILGIVVTWIFCAILTETGAIEKDPNAVGYGARTDLKIDVLDKASWIRFPYPGQWGMPTVSTAGVFGMLAGVLAGMLESIGDYYACARLAGAPPPPTHALNRGIMIEGIGCVLAGLWGTGTGTTSYSENIGAIGITKVGSRRVVQTGGALIILLGMLGKFGALFVTIPDPIIGGVFMTMFGMIAAVGVSNLQYVNLNSSRNLFIFGFSLFFGLSFPSWMSANSSVISTGSDIMDQIITVLLSTSMFVGGTMGFILDNTIPGTDKERGILAWKKQLETLNGEEAEQTDSKTYDIPLVTKYIRKVACFRLIPVCPTFAGCRKVKATNNDVELHVTAGSGSEANEGVRSREHDS